MKDLKRLSEVPSMGGLTFDAYEVMIRLCLCKAELNNYHTSYNMMVR